MGIFGLNKKEREIWKSITPGSKVRIILKEEGEIYESQVKEVSDSYIYIYTPKFKDLFLDVPPHTKVEIELINQYFGKVKFSSYMIAQEWLRDKIIKIPSPRRLYIIQRRYHHRVIVDLEGEFSFSSQDRGIDLIPPLLFSKIVNISEGGAMVVVDKLPSVEVGNFIDIKINLSQDSLIRAKAKIIHIEIFEGKYGLGIQFVKLPEVDKENLKKFIISHFSIKFYPMSTPEVDTTASTPEVDNG
ncbi:MAG: PilZ domain-containing protein [Candidatus Omnitrophica bacterium]|nr:PilZ domain-containing protein [Candidatus Omnitrophota bacterium]MCM8826404.1 PilZ domain-containing protein [Candidatus Omnitrophota bacterium]